MKPIKLTMQAFGSYAKKTEISFDKSRQNLFLVSGDTGSGKTTIFDAIVFALYGEASAEAKISKKDGGELQSHFADPNTEPYVELTFDEGDGTYKVRRVPPHSRPKKRGSGSVDKPGSVSLRMPDGSEYPAKGRETDKKLEEIVGLTKEQFMQVAMIAQGEFMNFLRAESNKKKEIFRKLFNTEMYQKIIDELKRRVDDNKSRNDRVKLACQTEAGHVKIPQDYEGADLMEKLKGDVAGEQFGSVDNFLKELRLLCDWLKEQSQAAEKTAEEAGSIRDEKRTAFTKAEALEESYKQLEGAKKKLDEYAAQEPAMKEKIALIASLRAAFEIKRSFERLEEAQTALRKTETELEECREKLPALESESRKLNQAETDEKNALDQRSQEYSAVKEKTDRALSALKEIAQAKKDKENAEDSLKKAQKEAGDWQKKFDELTNQEKDWKKESEECADAEQLVERLKSRIKELGGLSNDAAGVRKQERDAADQRKTHEQAQEEYNAAKARYEKHHELYESARRAYLDTQAGVLAADLKPGVPCPVCGSTEHPHPAVQAAGGENLSPEQLKKMENEDERLGDEQASKSKKASAEGARSEEKRNSLESALAELVRKLAEACPETPAGLAIDDAEKLISENQRAAEAEREKQKQRAERHRDLKKRLNDAETGKERLRAEIDAAKDRQSQANSTLEGLSKTIETHEAGLEYPTEQAALDALRAAEKSKNAQQATYDKAQKKAEAARENLTRTKDRAERCERDIPDQRKRRDDLGDAYRKLMKDKDLSELEWQELTESHAPTEPDRLQKEIDEYNNRKSAAEGALDAAKSATNGQPRPDLEKARRERDDADEKKKTADDARNSISSICTDDSGALSAIEKQMEGREKFLEEDARITSLHRRLAGKETGGKMDIETYAQRRYLEKILYAANRRFQEMSAGQYELRMVGIEAAGEGRSNSGLNLMVYSAVTGKEREIRTLSGGESFMAALSLALGMADQIQAKTSGIHLDIMFIDEGFGSLDDHSRDQAVRVLRAMAGGSKLIGIISHVSELKQQIEDHLLVTKDEHGSRVKWEIS